MALAPEEQASGGLPQFDVSTFESQLVWLIITMVLLYLVISRLAIPRVGRVLESREDHISANLDKAARDRQEAQEVEQQLEQALSVARADAQKTISDAKTEAQDKISKAASDVDADLAKRVEAAEQSIADAKAKALQDVKPIAEEAAVALVSRVMGDAGDEKAIGEAVDAALANRGEAS